MGSFIEISVAMVPSESTCDILYVAGAVRVVGSKFGVSDANAQQFVSYNGELYTSTIIARDADGSKECPLHELEVILPAGFGLDHELAVLTCNKKPSDEFQVASKSLCTNDPVANAVDLSFKNTRGTPLYALNELSSHLWLTTSESRGTARRCTLMSEFAMSAKILSGRMRGHPFQPCGCDVKSATGPRGRPHYFYGFER